MVKKWIGVLLVMMVVVWGVLFFIKDEDKNGKNGKNEKSELVKRDYTMTTDIDYPLTSPARFSLKADVVNDEQVQEVLNKVADDYKNKKLDSLRVSFSNLVGEAKGTFSIAFNKAGMDTAKVDEVGKWVRMP